MQPARNLERERSGLHTQKEEIQDAEVVGLGSLTIQRFSIWKRCQCLRETDTERKGGVYQLSHAAQVLFAVEYRHSIRFDFVEKSKRGENPFGASRTRGEEKGGQKNFTRKGLCQI